MRMLTFVQAARIQSTRRRGLESAEKMKDCRKLLQDIRKKQNDSIDGRVKLFSLFCSESPKSRPFAPSPSLVFLGIANFFPSGTFSPQFISSTYTHPIHRRSVLWKASVWLCRKIVYFIPSHRCMDVEHWS